MSHNYEYNDSHLNKEQSPEVMYYNYTKKNCVVFRIIGRYELYYSSTSLCWVLAIFKFLDPWMGDQHVRRPLYLHSEQHKHKINVHNTDIRVLSGIRTHDPSVRQS
jgi:hypothetical protein